MGAFSDASSGIRIAIIIHGRWHAWYLIPGWQTLDGAKDIGWAEAVGFELLVKSIVESFNSTGQFQTFGNNQGVVDGWRNGRSRNCVVNMVFCRIHNVLESTNRCTGIRVSYVPSESNPADAPPRGIYTSNSLLLPPVTLPDGLEPYLVDTTAPYSPSQLQHLWAGSYAVAIAKSIQRNVSAAGHRDIYYSRDLRRPYMYYAILRHKP